MDLFDLAADEPIPFAQQKAVDSPTPVVETTPPPFESTAVVSTPPPFELKPDPPEPDPPPRPLELEPAVEETGQMFMEGFYTKDDLDAMKVDEYFPRVDSGIETDFRCPCCGYEWSGSPKPKQEDVETT